MADKTWPVLLPNPVKMALNPVDRVERADMQQGPSRSRRRFTTSPTKVPVTFKFNQQQMAIFEAFHHYKLKDGAAWFNVDIANGQGLTSCEAKFSQIWKGSPVRNRWLLTAELEVKALPLMTEAALDALLV